MASPHRFFRVGLGLSLIAQIVLLAAIAYLNCGSTGPITGSPDCRPWIPAALLPILPSVLRVLALPAILIVPQFLPPELALIPAWLVEWTWLMIVGAINVTFWTASLGLAAIAVARRLNARRAHFPAP